MTPKPKDVHALTTEILDLERKLAAARQRWDALWSGSGMAQAPKSDKRTRSLAPDGISLKVLEYVTANPGRDLLIAQVSEAIDEGDLATGRALYRLAAGGKIVNPSRGIYRAKEKEVSSEESTS